jgi:F-type H+-transporting ATPase subunit delta
MNNHSSQAILYAKAVFNLALYQQRLVDWREVLEKLSQVVIACRESRVLINPMIRDEQKMIMFSGITDLPEVINLLKILARRNILDILPIIANKYHQMFLTHAGAMEVVVVSATELMRSQQEQLLNALIKRYQCKILLQYQVDHKLIGGVVIYAKDMVIDGSIRGILKRLKYNLFLRNIYVEV